MTIINSMIKEVLVVVVLVVLIVTIVLIIVLVATMTIFHVRMKRVLMLIVKKMIMQTVNRILTTKLMTKINAYPHKMQTCCISLLHITQRGKCVIFYKCKMCSHKCRNYIKKVMLHKDRLAFLIHSKMQ